MMVEGFWFGLPEHVDEIATRSLPGSELDRRAERLAQALEDCYQEIERLPEYEIAARYALLAQRLAEYARRESNASDDDLFSW